MSLWSSSSFDLAQPGANEANVPTHHIRLPSTESTQIGTPVAVVQTKASATSAPVKTRISPVSASTNDSSSHGHPAGSSSSSFYTASSPSLSSLQAMTMAGDSSGTDTDSEDGPVRRGRGAIGGYKQSSRAGGTFVDASSSADDSSSSEDPCAPIAIGIVSPPSKIALAQRTAALEHEKANKPKPIDPSHIRASSSSNAGRVSSVSESASDFKAPSAISYSERFRPDTPPKPKPPAPKGIAKLRMIIASKMVGMHVAPMLAGLAYLTVLVLAFTIPRMLEEDAFRAGGLSPFGSLSVHLSPSAIFSPFMPPAQQNQLRIDLKSAKCSGWMDAWWSQNSWRSSILVHGADPSDVFGDFATTAASYSPLKFVHAQEDHAPHTPYPPQQQPQHPFPPQQHHDQWQQQPVHPSAGFDPHYAQHPDPHYAPHADPHYNAHVDPHYAQHYDPSQQQQHHSSQYPQHHAAPTPYDGHPYPMPHPEQQFHQQPLPFHDPHQAPPHLQHQPQQHWTQPMVHPQASAPYVHDPHAPLDPYYAAQHHVVYSPTGVGAVPAFDPYQQQSHPLAPAMPPYDALPHLDAHAQHELLLQQQLIDQIEREHAAAAAIPTSSVGEVEMKLKQRLERAKEEHEHEARLNQEAAKEPESAAASHETGTDAPSPVDSSSSPEEGQPTGTIDSASHVAPPVVEEDPIAVLLARREKERLEKLEEDARRADAAAREKADALARESVRVAPVVAPAPPTPAPLPTSSMHSPPSHFAAFRPLPMLFYISCSSVLLMLPWVGLVIVIVNFALSVGLLLRLWWSERQAALAARAKNQPCQSKDDRRTLFSVIFGSCFSRCRKQNRGGGNPSSSVRPLPTICVTSSASASELFNQHWSSSWMSALVYCSIGGVGAYLLQRRCLDQEKRGKKGL